MREAARRVIPPGKRVLVISKGDDELLEIYDRPAFHFPADTSRRTGAEYLVIPATSQWWLDYYEKFEHFLSNQCERMAHDDDCTVYRLPQPAIAPAIASQRVLGVDIPPGIVALANDAATGMMDAGELTYLAAAAASVPWNDGVIAVEMGAFHGTTTVFLARVFEQLGLRVPILSTDPFERVEAEDRNPQGSYAEYLRTIEQAELERICMPLVGFSQDAAPLVPDRIGLLIVDGWHEYAAVRQDLELYALKLIDGGMMVLDDYGVLYPGVVQAADEFFEHHLRFEVVHKSHFVVAKCAARQPESRRRSNARSNRRLSEPQST